MLDGRIPPLNVRLPDCGPARTPGAQTPSHAVGPITSLILICPAGTSNTFSVFEGDWGDFMVSTAFMVQVSFVGVTSIRL